MYQNMKHFYEKEIVNSTTKVEERLFRGGIQKAGSTTEACDSPKFARCTCDVATTS